MGLFYVLHTGNKNNESHKTFYCMPCGNDCSFNSFYDTVSLYGNIRFFLCGHYQNTVCIQYRIHVLCDVFFVFWSCC
jgi:hypothetical protein